MIRTAIHNRGAERRREEIKLCPDPRGARFLTVVVILFLLEMACIVGGWWWLRHRGLM
jgi:hypothetical protein